VLYNPIWGLVAMGVGRIFSRGGSEI